MAGEEEWMEKHMEGKGKQHGWKPRIPEPIARKLTKWGNEGTLDTYGHLPMEQWMDGADEYQIKCTLLIEFLSDL